MAAGSAPPHLGDGFVKYIDPTSGYAYYHNAATNESVWATEEEAAEPLAKTPSGGDAFEPVWEATKDERAVDVDAGGDDDDAAARGGGDDAASDGDAESGDDDDSDDDSDDDGGAASDDDFDPELDEKFSRMLATPEGQAALEAERTRADRLLEARRRESYERWLRDEYQRPATKAVTFEEPPPSLAARSLSLLALPVRVPVAIGAAIAGWVVGLFAGEKPPDPPASGVADVV